MKQPENTPVFNEDILLYAFRYAIEKMTYAVHDLSANIKANYDFISNHTKKLISDEIQAYQDEFGEIGIDVDNDEWNKIKWLFDKKRHVQVQVKNEKDKWVKIIAVAGDDEKHYSIPLLDELEIKDEDPYKLKGLKAMVVEFKYHRFRLTQPQAEVVSVLLIEPGAYVVRSPFNEFQQVRFRNQTLHRFKEATLNTLIANKVIIPRRHNYYILHRDLEVISALYED